MNESNQGQANPLSRVVIAPTIGRVVWYWPGKDGAEAVVSLDAEQPMKADVVFVHPEQNEAGEFVVNLGVVDHAGRHVRRHNIPLVQRMDGSPEWQLERCQWMPYQVGQARANIPASLVPAGVAGLASMPKDAAPIDTTAGSPQRSIG